jgi:hypothetical protein
VKVLKVIALSFLSFILLISLCIFGVVYTVNRIALNPAYVTKVVNQIDYTSLIQDTVDKQVDQKNISPELRTALIDTLSSVEPVLKQRLGSAIDDSYSYLNGQNGTPDLNKILSDSVINQQFVSDLLDKIDLSNLLDQSIKDQAHLSGFSSAFKTALVNAVDKSEPAIKKQLVTAADPILKYILGQTTSVDLQNILRQTIFSDSSLTVIINNMDFDALTKEILNEEIGSQLPEGIILTGQQTDRMEKALQPTIQTALTTAIPAIADYLTGVKSDFTINVDLGPAMPTLKTIVKEAFTAQLPANLAGATQSQIDTAYDKYYADYSGRVPATYNVDANNLEPGFSNKISDALANAQTSITNVKSDISQANLDYADGLQTAKTAVGYFRTGFICLIILILLVMAGIILIYRNVKNACLDLGIIFLLWGIIEVVGALLLKNFGLNQISESGVSTAVSNTYKILLNEAVSPLQMIGIAGMILGALLIIAAFVYPRLKQRTPQPL